MKFKVWDTVIINEKGNEEYTYTKKGSIGQVLGLAADGRISVKFSKLTGRYSGYDGEDNPTYDISEEHLELFNGIRRDIKLFGIAKFCLQNYKED